MHTSLSFILTITFPFLFSSGDSQIETESPNPTEITGQLRMDTVSSDLESTISKVVAAYQQKDSEVISSLIHPRVGITTLYRMGVFDQYSTQFDFDFEAPNPEWHPYPKIATDRVELEYKELPSYDCDMMKWEITGLFCDTSTTNHLLSTSAIDLVKYREDDIPESEIAAFYELEKVSHRVIWATPQVEFIFYLSYIDEGWYLTIIDRVTTDCSA